MKMIIWMSLLIGIVLAANTTITVTCADCASGITCAGKCLKATSAGGVVIKQSQCVAGLPNCDVFPLTFFTSTCTYDAMGTACSEGLCVRLANGTSCIPQSVIDCTVFGGITIGISTSCTTGSGCAGSNINLLSNVTGSLSTVCIPTLSNCSGFANSNLVLSYLSGCSGCSVNLGAVTGICANTFFTYTGLSSLSEITSGVVKLLSSERLLVLMIAIIVAMFAL